MRINHNIQALNAYRNLNQTMNATSKSLEKLSSGLRINRAADDAAGLAISEKMRSQIRGLGMAERNSLDAVSLIQTAEGALSSTHDILQRMRELSVQAANDTLEDSDRQAIQDEVNQLTFEIDRISDTTQFNQKKLLNGSEFGKAFTSINSDSIQFDGVNTFEGIIEATPTKPAEIKLDITPDMAALAADNTGMDEKTIEINGKTYEFDTQGGVSNATNIVVSLSPWTPADGTDSDAVAANMDKITSALSAAINANDDEFSTQQISAGSDGTAVTQNGQLIIRSVENVSPADVDNEVHFNRSITSDFSADELKYRNAATDAELTSATFIADTEAANASRVTLTMREVPKSGDAITIDGFTFNFGTPEAVYNTGGSSVTIDPTNKSVEDILNQMDSVLETAIGEGNTNVSAVDQTKSVSGNTITIGTIKTADGSSNGMEIAIKDADINPAQNEKLSLMFQIGGNEEETMVVDIEPMDTAKLGIARAADGTPITSAGTNAELGVNVMTAEDARKAISTFDNAIKLVSAERSKLGAFQNRLEHTVTNLQSAHENLTAAESRIRDLDMAKEMSQFTRNNILNQAGQAMLAQANQLPQGILQLLQ
ncbi:flagellin [Jeotgalibacillus malaysiensis]|uniref:flagellin N-terminal helical domain-containing protein n=1 Tax=Jeotgalibacillus malaysiensis TaxID=1508404 RepID=UPI00384F4558